MKISNSEILNRRLVNQRLSWSKFRNAADVVHWFGAVQAQEFPSAKWAVALRMRAATETAIEEAYNEGAILRTHLMRPTWHFVAADDIRWLLQLTGPRVNASCASRYRKLELDAATFSRANRTLTKALQGEQHMTRGDLRQVLNRAGVGADNSERLAHILLRAELDGVICSGRRIGNQVTYALLEERVPPTASLSRDEALVKLTRRYFRSHGPATLQDFIWWSGLTAADAKKGLALVERALTKAEADETVYWMPRSAVPEPGPQVTAYLLPAFDEYLVAYKDRVATIDAKHAALAKENGGGLGPAIILEGKNVGSWKRVTEKASTRICLNPFRALNRKQNRAIAEAADRYAAYLL
jgi:hypothetical protein